MHRDDFFREPAFGLPGGASLDTNLLRKVRREPLPGVPDAELGLALAQLLHDELQIYGTSGGQTMTDEDLREALPALKAVCSRLGITYNVPFRDFTDFRSYWGRKGASGSGGWQARRDVLMSIFGPMHEALEVLDQQSLAATLAKPISPQEATGWPAVDSEIHELRRQFQSASTPQDYNAVGLVCVRVTHALSATVYRADRHLQAGGSEPPVTSTKARLERFVEVELAGGGNAELRKLARSVIEAAEAVKHGDTPSRTAAGIAADAVILLANILRRIAGTE